MKTKLPLVDVITCAYNHEKYIEKCIKSVINQKTNFNYRYLIGDDFSIDKTRSIIEGFKKKYPKIIIPFYNKENLGAEKNTLNLFSNVKAKYIALLDGDDYWIDPYKLQKQVDFLEKNKSCSYVFTSKKVLKKDGALMLEKKNDLTNLFDLHYLLKKNIMPSSLTVMFRKAFLPEKFPSFYWEAFNGDWVLLFLLTHNSKIGFINEETAVYRQGVGIISKTKNSIKFKNGLKTNKELNKLTNYKYDYHLGKKEWFHENICFGFLKEGKKGKGLSKVIVKLFYSLKENNFENFIKKNIVFLKHIYKLTFKKTT